MSFNEKEVVFISALDIGYNKLNPTMGMCGYHSHVEEV
jgi:hypothetical protein